jgi:hypothetical protein
MLTRRTVLASLAAAATSALAGVRLPRAEAAEAPANVVAERLRLCRSNPSPRHGCCCCEPIGFTVTFDGVTTYYPNARLTRVNCANPRYVFTSGAPASVSPGGTATITPA